MTPREAKAPVETERQSSRTDEVTVRSSEQSEKTKCVRQVGLLSTMGVDSCGVLPLVREDRGELTSGLPAVVPTAPLGSYVGTG